MNWVELSAALGIWATLGSTYGYWRHQQGKDREQRQADALAALRTQMTLEHDAVLGQMTRERDTITTQIKDIVRSLGDNYVGRRENDVAMRMVGEQLVEMGKQIGAVGVQVGNVQSRVDELFTKAEFRRTSR